MKKLNVSLKIDFSCVNVSTSSEYRTDKIQMPLELQVEIYFILQIENETKRSNWEMKIYSSVCEKISLKI